MYSASNPIFTDGKKKHTSIEKIELKSLNALTCINEEPRNVHVCLYDIMYKKRDTERTARQAEANLYPRTNGININGIKYAFRVYPLRKYSYTLTSFLRTFLFFLDQKPNVDSCFA